MIGDNIAVTVLEVINSQVSLGTKAPRYIAVHRGEIYRRIQQQRLWRRRQKR